MLVLQVRSQYLGGSQDGYSNQAAGAVTLNNQTVYCNGGNKDGYTIDTSAYFLLNIQSIYCNGGNKDGYERMESNAAPLYNQSVYCSGGDKDGYDRSNFVQGILNVQTFYCSGGNRDGYGSADTLHGPFNDQSFYCSSGDGDGDGRSYLAPALFFDQSIYCSGGNRDGYFNFFMPLDSLGNGIWTGVASTDWNTAGNWANNVVPTVNDLVYIPTGCVFYPSLTSGLSINNSTLVHQCKSLEIQEGAEMSISNSGLSNTGRMVVAGNFTATSNDNLSHGINSGGSLNILNNGIVRIGNQSTGTGLADLTVLPGGTLYVTGGVLEIDDQLNILGTFNMTSGYVFAHKYGAGSAITAISGPFIVSPGASGNVSGGIIRVCGKDGGNFPAIALNDADFDFTGASILMITNGISTTRTDVTLKTVNGANLNNLIISKPAYNVNLASGMVFNGQISVLEGSTLKVNTGSTIQEMGTQP